MSPRGGDPWPGARPYVGEAEPGEPMDGLTREWSEAMAEARAMRAAVMAAEAGAHRHARRHAFPAALGRGTAAVLLLLGAWLVAAGTAVRDWTS